jgi:ATP-dependent Clp protease ATP-binding subunit ClpB
VKIQLKRVADRIAEGGFNLQLSQAAVDYLTEIGYDPVYGARPLKRAIQRELQDPLALLLLGGEFRAGETIRVDRGADGLMFAAIPTAQPVEGPAER